MSLISIIIPCFNAENYIDRCMNTIVNQTIGIENLEVILVDDASTDHTLDKLKAWEQQYPDNVLVITYEENLRQGGARNIGLQYATADYIGFVDADDWIEFSMYEKLYSCALDGKYDMVQCKCTRDAYVGEHATDNSRQRNVSYTFEQREGFFIWDVPDYGDCGETGSIWSAIYKTSCIMENNIWFPEHVAYEDNYWLMVLHLYIKNLYVLDEVLYHYYVNTSSTTATKNALHHLDRLDIEVGIIEAYKERGAFMLFHEVLEWNFIKRFYLNTLYIVFTRFDEIPEIFTIMKEKIFEYFPNWRHNPHISSCNQREELLLELLELPNLTLEDLYRVKKAYLASLS
ncbi:MAG: glycosyltransferase [Lachnospiraceae bacterium]|nr:glycosyltransferase [Lachnospiraceae bacterium]